MSKADPRTVETVRQFAEKTGRRVVYENTAEVQGFKSDGYIDADGTIHIDNETRDPLDFVVKHELTHYLQNFKAEYRTFEQAAFKSKTFSNWLNEKAAGSAATVEQLRTAATYAMQNQSLTTEQQQVLQRAANKLNDLAENGMGRSVHQRQAAYVALKQAQYAVSSNGAVDLSVTEAKNEMIANFAGESLFAEEGSGLLEIANGITDTKRRSAFVQKILDFVNYIKERLMGLNARFDTAQLERMYKTVLNGENVAGGVASGQNTYNIVALADGRTYVQASRNVITGDNPNQWRAQITAFFKELLNGRQSIDLDTIEGDTLTISKKETAAKARDNYKTENGQPVKMTDDEFRVKLHVESHIDEIAETAFAGKGGSYTDTKSHAFAKDGFTYRTAFFGDFDGEYYKVRLSIGHNGTTATVYNVGKTEKGAAPSAKKIAVVGSPAPWRSPLSNNSIPTSGGNVKENFSIPDDAQHRFTHRRCTSRAARHT